jgi:hypothetical protein
MQTRGFSEDALIRAFIKTMKIKLFLPAILVLAALSGLFGCSSDKPAEKEAQKQSAEQQASGTAGGLLVDIRPETAYRDSQLIMSWNGFDLTNAKIEWLVNSVAMPSAMINQFRSADLRKGDTVQVRAVVDGREIRSKTVTIKNTPPEVSRVKMLPDPFKPGDMLSVEVTGKDLDGDPVTFMYEWTNNNSPAGKGKTIDSAIKRGDKVSVKITPYDGEEYGRASVPEIEVGNLPPVIIEENKFNFDGKVFTSQVKATDPDGDALVYSLKAGPAGMTIDPNTGVITWNVPPDFKGKASFTSCASDGKGGVTTRDMTVEINAAVKK